MNHNLRYVFLCILVVAVLFTACGKKTNETLPTDFSVEVVTDVNGEVVTDAAGEAVTEIFENVPVTDARGEQVTTVDGEAVTQRIPQKDIPKKEENPRSPAQQLNTADKQEPGADVPKPTTKPSEKPITPTPKPTPTPQPKPTEPPKKPTEPQTEPPTEKPKPPEKVYTAQYFVDYAIQYGKSIGLEYRPDMNKDTGSWDDPMDIRKSVKESETNPYTGENLVNMFKRYIRSSLDTIKQENSANHQTVFWVQLLDDDENPNDKWEHLYIGY